MRIAIDSYHAQRKHGGIARYVRGLVGEMSRIASDDYFMLFANRFREPDVMWQLPQSNVGCCEARLPRRVLQAAWHHLDWPRVEQWTGITDLFHATHFVLPATRAKTVLTVHDLTWLRHPEFFADQQLNARGYGVELPRALDRADAIIAVSSATKIDLIECMGIAASRISVIHEGVEPHFFIAPDDPAIAKVVARHRIPANYMIFLVGTPEPRKNLMRTIAAVRAAKTDLPLVIVGPVAPLRAMIDEGDDLVHLIGSVSDDELPLLLAGAEMALYPSLYEGFGLPLLEAMAAGTPVITSNVSACPEVVDDAGICVDPYDEHALAIAIARLHGDEALRMQLRQRGKMRAETLSWHRAAQQTLALYRQLL
ncbi:MAG: glycosyltransferase family 1 protein [Mariprofundales bacterium]